MVGLANLVLRRLHPVEMKAGQRGVLFSSMGFYGITLGMLVFGYAIDRVGRKNGMFIVRLFFCFFHRSAFSRSFVIQLTITILVVIPPLFVLYFRSSSFFSSYVYSKKRINFCFHDETIEVGESIQFKTQSMSQVASVPWFLILKRYWRPFIGLSLSWYIVSQFLLFYLFIN